MASETGAAPAGSRRSLKVLAALAAGAVLLLALWRLPLAGAIAALAGWMRGTGPLGALVYALVYIVACVALVPASPLTLAAGFVYGPIWGTALVSPASVIGATAAFLVGRSLARGWVERRLGKRPWIHAVDEAVSGGGFKVVALLRLSPLFPFNLLNYALSLTRISTRDFVLGSFVGMLPGTFLYVYLGSVTGSLAEVAAGEPAPSSGRAVLLAAGLIATAVVTVLVTRRARAALAAHLPEGAAGRAAEPR